MNQGLSNASVKKYDIAANAYKWSNPAVDHLTTFSWFGDKGRVPQSSIGYAAKAGLVKAGVAVCLLTTVGLAGAAGLGFIDRAHHNTPANEVGNFLNFPYFLFSSMRDGIKSPATIDNVMGYGGAFVFGTVGVAAIAAAGKAVAQNGMLEEVKRRAVVSMLQGSGHFKNLSYNATLDKMYTISAERTNDPNAYNKLKESVRTSVAETCHTHPEAMNALNKALKRKNVKGAKTALSNLQKHLQQ